MALAALMQELSLPSSALPSSGAQVAETDFTVTVLANLDLIEACARELGAPTGFQTAQWLGGVYRHHVLGSAQPIALAFHNATTGELAACLALYVVKKGGFTIARFADCGVSDYNAMLGSLAPHGRPAEARALVARITAALPAIDVLSLERIPVQFGDALGFHPLVTPSRLLGHAVTIDTNIEDYLRGLGKKYRKEVERCYRGLSALGPWSFVRATGAPAVTQAFEALEVQQFARMTQRGEICQLSENRFGTFYREALVAGDDRAQIFTLSLAGETIATLMGILHGNTFTALRIATAGAAYRHVSPGRLIMIETMRHLRGAGITTFDMGIGDYAFKRGFGARAFPLVDLVVPVSARGLVYVAGFRLKTRLRQSSAARALVASARRLMGARKKA